MPSSIGAVSVEAEYAFVPTPNPDLVMLYTSQTAGDDIVTAAITAEIPHRYQQYWMVTFIDSTDDGWDIWQLDREFPLDLVQ